MKFFKLIPALALNALASDASDMEMNDHFTCVKVKDSLKFEKKMAHKLVANSAQKLYSVKKCRILKKGAVKFCAPSTMHFDNLDDVDYDPSLGGLVDPEDPQRSFKNDVLCYIVTCKSHNFSSQYEQRVMDQFSPKETLTSFRKLTIKTPRNFEVCVPAWKLKTDGSLVVINPINKKSEAPSQLPSKSCVDDSRFTFKLPNNDFEYQCSDILKKIGFRESACRNYAVQCCESCSLKDTNAPSAHPTESCANNLEFKFLLDGEEYTCRDIVEKRLQDVVCEGYVRELPSQCCESCSHECVDDPNFTFGYTDLKKYQCSDISKDKKMRERVCEKFSNQCCKSCTWKKPCVDNPSFTFAVKETECSRDCKCKDILKEGLQERVCNGAIKELPFQCCYSCSYIKKTEAPTSVPTKSCADDPDYKFTYTDGIVSYKYECSNISEVKGLKDKVCKTNKEVAKQCCESCKYPTASPTKSPSSQPTSSPPPLPKVVTLGDSYSSGTGIHRDDEGYDEPLGGQPTLNGVTYKLKPPSLDNKCWRETDTTPGPMYANQVGLQSIFLACKGAQIFNLNQQLAYLNALYPDDRQHNWEGSTILLTGGGNDVMTKNGMTWAELLEECIVELSIFNGCHDESGNQIANFGAIQTSLSSFLENLSTDASGAKIRVLGYPKMMQRDPSCWSVTGVSKNEADWIDQMCIKLNNAIMGAVAFAKNVHPNVDISFVNVYNYLTVGACGNGPNNRHVHDKRLSNHFPWPTSDASFHPSQLGYTKYYNALVASL
mmetsp:Transcript_7027/g.14628  ORF Transcript_7027/g.14628 Transcript_7027/m.14628 type:complete len:773 (-) Transcript_7027:45-2363(-)|eukprot:CAMPEP_0194314652 /NCGR_PEP_ID=MMETSP0171-20130528/11503_1 /TAXON_ID=218684 /ORGANISM="Corethron pennatum, Strain L29A3" /LENGTH=772 /DNA_ID=CAMNT_0039070171 /DNA_START=108 /DNA_END=2426 /DNA_ORIENTATION=+